MSIERSQRLTLSDLKKHPDPFAGKDETGVLGSGP